MGSPTNQSDPSSSSSIIQQRRGVTIEEEEEEDDSLSINSNERKTTLKDRQDVN